MKKWNRENGFTLVELLAVIVILAIILIIAVPGVLSIINQTKQKGYDSQLAMIKDAARNYVTTNTITWSGDDPKRTVVTLDMLQSGGYIDKKIIDPRNKKEILCADVLVTKDNKNKISYDIDLNCQSVMPNLGSGMIPIVYNDGNWVKADRSNKDFGWFNYDEQQWANVATVTEDVRDNLMKADIGTVIPMDKINTMFVWVPRFKYKLFNVDGTISPVGNSNLAGDNMINVELELSSTKKSNGSQNGQWLTHPAFTFGGQELDGFWVAKFETGYAGATTTADAQQNIVDPYKVIVKPSVYSWRCQVVSMYKNARGINGEGNPYGFTNKQDSHMMKNMEWGAMVYLTQSKYGKQGNPNYSGAEKQVKINNNNLYLTGCGADVQNAALSETCNPYETQNGQSASTTGNISGIYDTSGGTAEAVAAVGLILGSEYSLDTAFSGFLQDELDQIGVEGKYLDKYLSGWTYEEYWRGHLGDATKEMGPFSEKRGAWYDSYAFFIAEMNPWFIRGVVANVDFLTGNGWNDGVLGSHLVIL